MKSNLLKLGCTAFLAASIAVSTSVIAAQDDAYTANDVLLFLQNPAGAVGNDKVVYFSLGSSVSVFRDATAGSVSNLGNINTTLNATFGSDWVSKNSTIFAGAAGQNGNTNSASTAVSNGDYARTIYVTKARTSLGTVGQPNSASPLFDPAEAAVAGMISGSNFISGMTQPGTASFSGTLIDQYNPISSGNPTTAYGAISGGIQNNIGNQTATFGSVANVVTALDLYRVTKTTGTDASSNSIWHVANNKTATYSDNSYPGSNGSRADYLGTITLSSDGSVNFIAQGTAPIVDNAYSTNDILLFLQNPGGTTGNDKVAYYSLGSATGVFRDATAGSVSNLGNINTTLNATFGSDWVNKNSTIFAGAAGQNGNTNSASTAVSNGDYARTIYVTKARTSLGIVGQPNSASPLFDPAEAAVAGMISGSNFISGMTQPGTASFSGTLIDQYNPISNGNPTTAYGAISGGIQNNIGNQTATFGSVANVVTALDLYRVTKTTGTNASSSSNWHVANNKTATYSDNSYPGSNGARADYLGTITLSSDGSVNFVSVSIIAPTEPPVINSSTTANGTVGSAFSYAIAASNSPTSYNATPLPAGLSINTNTGAIIGTPTTAGNTTVTLTATNAVGSDTETLEITIQNPPAPVINSATTANGTVGSSFTYTITASNSPTSFAATGLPAGLSINTSTGVISGTPTTPGNTSVTLTTMNAGGSDTETLEITIQNPPAPVINSATTANGTVGSSFTYTITATNTPTSYNATSLPAGLSVNATTGVISGTPTTAGSTTVTLTATNAGGSDTETLTITIAAAAVAPSVTSGKIALAQIGVPFSYAITVNNTATGYSATTLPSGLTLNSTSGVISGTPTGNQTSATTSNITLTATNAGGNGTATLELYMAPTSKTPPSLIFRNGVSLPVGGEISSYANGTVLTTNSGNNTGTVAHGVQVYTLTSNATLEDDGFINLSSVFGGVSNISSVTSVVADPRGFGVASIVPTGITANDIGRIAIFDTNTGEILKTLNVGYHPDSVAMTPDRTKILVANEGEYNEDESFARPGSLSVIDISSVKSVSDIANLSQSNVATFDFQDFNLGTGVTLRGVRDNTLAMNTANTTANFANIEAEYITATNTQAYVTLQENNAIATFDFATRKFTRIANLGSITQTVDASDRDGSSNGKRISINDTVAGLPMPDTMVSFSKNGTLFLVTANEGDARPDDGDILRGADLISANLTSSNATTAINNGLTRLNLLNNVGDTNGDGKIDQPTMMGTRSFTIWNAATGNRTYDSGSTIETYVANNNPFTFNMNSGSTSNWDTRSDDKGPEPEALAYGSIAGRDYVFVGNERENGIIAFDITNTANVTVAGYFNTITNTTDIGGSFISPESITFVPADQNPTRKNLLVVGYEGTGTNGSLAVYEFRPPLSGNLTITSNGTATGRKDQPFNYPITANMPVVSYTINGTLPTGLQFDSNTGVISGTPSGNVTLTSNVTIGVTANITLNNGTISTVSANRTLSISINGTAFPVITSNASASGTQGSQFSYTINATNKPIIAYSIVGPIPAGLTLNSTSGLISGTPNVAGNFSVGLLARNSAGNSTVQPLAIQISAAALPVFNSYTTTPAGSPFQAFNTQNASITVNATSAVKYQWRFNGKPIAGAIGATYNLGPAASTKVGNYDVVLTNAGNQTVISTPIAFSLKPAATVGISAGNQSITQGFNAVYNNGSNATFSVNATDAFGTPSYQWFRNGVAITGATNATYTIPSVTSNSSGAYRVQVTTKNGTVTTGTISSPEWVVSVNGAPSITNPGNRTAFVGTPFTFNATISGNASSLTLNGTLPAGLTYNATARRIAGTATAVGNFPIRLTPVGNGTGPGAPATLNIQVVNPPTPQIASLTVNGNSTASTVGAYNTQAGPVFQVAVTNPDNHPLKYQWRLNGAPILGANSTTLNVGTATAAKTGIYDVLVTNAVNSAIASRQVNFSLTPIVNFTVTGGANQFLAAGNSTTFSVGNLTQADPTATPIYQWFRDGVAIVGANGASYTTNSTGIYSVRVTSTLGATILGNVTSSTWSVAREDNSAGILVYNITGNATRTIGSTEFTGNFTGYMVVDRINNNGAFIQTYNVGFAKRNSLEERPDIAAASTGPVVGSRTVFAGSVISRNETVLSGNLTGNQSFTIDDPDIDHDLVWITGRDVENTFPATTTPSVQPAVKLYAPATMSGVAGMLFRDGATVEIDSFNVTLTLNPALTANAYRSNQNLNQAIESTRAAARAAGFTDEVEE